MLRLELESIGLLSTRDAPLFGRGELLRFLMTVPAATGASSVTAAMQPSPAVASGNNPVPVMAAVNTWFIYPMLDMHLRSSSLRRTVTSIVTIYSSLARAAVIKATS